MGRWLEEGEEIGVHPRDPYHRIDVVRHRPARSGSRSTESCWPRPTRALALFESNLPAALVHPARGRAWPTLEPSDTVTRCPYKGTAGYYSVRLATETGKDLVWYYEDPLPEVGRIAGLLCFFNEQVDIELDGELQERPESPWSRRVRSDVRGARPRTRPRRRRAASQDRAAGGRPPAPGVFGHALPGDADGGDAGGEHVGVPVAVALEGVAVAVKVPAVELDDQAVRRGSSASTS